jgi:hypothetical protein
VDRADLRRDREGGGAHAAPGRPASERQGRRRRIADDRAAKDRHHHGAGRVDARCAGAVQDRKAVLQGDASDEGAQGGVGPGEDEGGGNDEGALRKRHARDREVRSVVRDLPRPFHRVGVTWTGCTRRPRAAVSECNATSVQIG